MLALVWARTIALVRLLLASLAVSRRCPLEELESRCPSVDSAPRCVDMVSLRGSDGLPAGLRMLRRARLVRVCRRGECQEGLMCVPARPAVAPATEVRAAVVRPLSPVKWKPTLSRLKPVAEALDLRQDLVDGHLVLSVSLC